MSPKPRKSYNKKLPARWRFKHGSYYYRVPPGLEYQWDNKTEFIYGQPHIARKRLKSNKRILLPYIRLLMKSLMTSSPDGICTFPSYQVNGLIGPRTRQVLGM
jgi:hypothetical protein